MSKQQEGVVISAAGEMARVKTSRHNDCENCGACPGNAAIVLDARNPLGARPGQQVLIEVQEVGMLKSAFIVYMLPLISLFVGAVAGGLAADQAGSGSFWYQVAGALVALVLAIAYIRHYDRRARTNKNMQPVITRILS